MLSDGKSKEKFETDTINVVSVISVITITTPEEAPPKGTTMSTTAKIIATWKRR